MDRVQRVIVLTLILLDSFIGAHYNSAQQGTDRDIYSVQSITNCSLVIYLSVVLFDLISLNNNNALQEW